MWIVGARIIEQLCPIDLQIFQIGDKRKPGTRQIVLSVNDRSQINRAVVIQSGYDL